MDHIGQSITAFGTKSDGVSGCFVYSEPRQVNNIDVHLLANTFLCIKIP